MIYRSSPESAQCNLCGRWYCDHPWKSVDDQKNGAKALILEQLREWTYGEYTSILWFGRDWGAPICIPAAKIATPLEHPCIHCQGPFERGDHGVTMPLTLEHKTVCADYHLECFKHHLGIT
jgi:hypothetical protein